MNFIFKIDGMYFSHFYLYTVILMSCVCTLLYLWRLTHGSENTFYASINNWLIDWVFFDAKLLLVVTIEPKKYYFVASQVSGLVVAFMTRLYAWNPFVCGDTTVWLRVVIARMMTSSNENIFRVTGPLCGEFTGHAGEIFLCERSNMLVLPFALCSDKSYVG